MMTLRAIYAEHVDFVWRTLRRLGVSEHDLADAVQDVFLLVHAHLPAFEGRSSLRTWIFTISRSVAKKSRAGARRVPVSSTEGELDSALDLDLRADVARSAEHREKLETLLAILAPLPVEQRTVFVLFELEQWTGAEISEALQVPLATVYSRLLLARRAFRRGVARLEGRERWGRVGAGNTKFARSRAASCVVDKNG